MLTEQDLKNSLPDTATTQYFSKLKAGAIIVRDKWGIPHIKSDSLEDLFFAQGFSTAQDRLFQMDFDRMRCLGRLSEYLGKETLDQDILMRRRNLLETSKSDLSNASKICKDAFHAYSNGVNAFLETTENLPVEYKLLGSNPEPWEDWHSVLVYKVRNTAEGSFQGKLWLSKLVNEIGPAGVASITPGYQPESLLTLPPGGIYKGPQLSAIDELNSIASITDGLKSTEGGSNGWVISGDNTISGLPLLAGDSHRGLEVPNVYYQIHLSAPDLEIVGFSIPGMPFVLHFCHNENVAWGMTHGGVDTQDLFVEQLRRSKTGVDYLSGDEWISANTREEIVKVKDGSDVKVEVIRTDNRYIIQESERSDVGLSLMDPGSCGATNWIDSAYKAMLARSADELENALNGWTDRVNNYPYADCEGNFGYSLKGKIPIRNEANGWGQVRADLHQNKWRGFIKSIEMPRVRNPKIGFIVTCNQRVVDETFPYYLTHMFGTDYRARRIIKKIKETKLENIETPIMSLIHADCKSIPAETVVKALLSMRIDDEKSDQIIKMMSSWNYDMNANSQPAAIYGVINRFLSIVLAEKAYGKLSQDIIDGIPGAEDHMRRQIKPDYIRRLSTGSLHDAPYHFNPSSVLTESLQRSVEYLYNRLGPDIDTWRWGNLHKTAYQHPLSKLFPLDADKLTPPNVETSGDSDTPFASGSSISSEFITETGPVNRYIHDPSDWTNSRWIVPLGSSGHPGSIHFSDQQVMWSKVETIPQLWNWKEINLNAETKQHLLKPDLRTTDNS